ncbi:MAG: maleylpyruvate isomerase family mycothiol-dependent enzyme [Streptosporangiaceae bacterium]
MTDQATLGACVEQCYDAIESVCARLTGPQWQTPSLCPDWTARDVVAHLGMMERVLTGWLPSGADELAPVDRIGPYQQEVAALDDQAFASLVTEIFAARRADLARLTGDDLRRPSWTPVGQKTYGQFLEIRIFDFWVHERDITTPLRWPTDDGGPRAEIALGQVESSIGYIVGKKVALPDGTSIVFHLTGPIAKDIAVIVDGRARQVDRVASPTVELTTDSTTFIQLAAGRIDPQIQLDTGKVLLSGDRDLASHAAHNLRFTI